MFTLPVALAECASMLRANIVAGARASAVFAVCMVWIISLPHAAQAQSCTGSWLYHAPDQQRPGIDLFNNRTPDCVIGWDPDGQGPQQEWTIVGGLIDKAGNTPVANIAAFDGTQWRALGAGFNQRVRQLAVLNGELYAAGDFTASGATSVSRVARWDGTSWQALGTGPGGSVNTMHVWNNQIVVSQAMSGGNGNARVWNGAAWTTLGAFGGQIGAFATYNSQLVAASTSTTPAGRIAAWNGSAWVALGSGVNGAVESLAVLNNDLIAAGFFTTAGGSPVSNIARWNGTSWSALGSGINARVNALAVLGNEVFACGNFSNAGGVAVSNVAKWNGTSWTATSSGLVNEGSPVDMAVVRGRINVVGNFTHAASTIPMSGIAIWNATENRWQAVSSSFDANVNGFLEFQGSMYAFGSFTRAGGDAAGSVAKWDGLAWRPVGTNALRFTHALVEYNGQLVAAGSNPNQDGTFNQRVMRFDGTTWLPLTDEASSTFVGPANDLIVYNGDLYASGQFSVAGGVPANCIARWDGLAWNPLQQGLTGIFGSQSSVFASALAVFQNELYVGGAFVNAGSVTNVNHIARWNGSTWNRAGTLNGYNPFAFVGSLQEFQGQLYATGNALFGSNQEIGRWNGLTWTGISPGLGFGGGRSMCVHNGRLYVGGAFTSAGGSTSIGIARYTGTAWQTVGTQGLGFNPGNRDTVTALASYKGEVLIGGIFPAIDAGTFTGGTGSGNFARFTETNIPWIARQPQDVFSCVGNTVQFTSAVATGYTNVTYRWQIASDLAGVVFRDLASNDAPGVSTVSGQTTPTVTITLVDSGSGFDWNHKLRLVASNACGQTTSDTADLSIVTPPTIVQSPADGLTCPQALTSGVRLSVVVGPPLVSYNLLWQIEDPAVPTGWRTLEEHMDVLPLVLANGETCGEYVYLPSQTLELTNLCPGVSGTRFRAIVNNFCGESPSQPAAIGVSTCDCIDFNADTLFPDDADLLDFLTVLSGGDCSPGNTCSDIDFNNDGLFPDDTDLIAFLTVLAGGAC